MTGILLLYSAMILFCGSYITFRKGQEKAGMILLFCAALLLRFFMAQLDPYLHEWDERFHALVAKNMMQHPMTPMLRKDMLLPYDYKDWSDNHIWLHKQPLFLWQMALSMRLFGINTFAVRFPGVLEGALLTLVIYRMGRLAFNKNTGYFGALFFAFSYFQLEQCSGLIGMDQNDIAFCFYVTLSLWALMEYLHSGHWIWIICIGFFAGAAVLVKWLTGMLVFACWAIQNLTSHGLHVRRYPWLKICMSLALALAVFLPWQIYILHAFPVESRWEYTFNTMHINKALEGHRGSAWYYFGLIPVQYNLLILIPLMAGLAFLFRNPVTKGLHIVLLSAVLLIYIFFSFIVKTKMPGFVFVISPLLLLIAGHGTDRILSYLRRLVQKKILREILCAALVLTMCMFAFNFSRIRTAHVKGHSAFTENYRAEKLHNTAIYKKLDSLAGDCDVVFNCPPTEDVDAMFFSDKNVYAWYPDETQLDSIRSEGHKVAAFASWGKQGLPPYMEDTSTVHIIPVRLE